MHSATLDCVGCIQWTVQPLVDNYEEDEYQYLIHVHTGFKMGSGTKSNVFFRLNGTEGETGVRKMADGVREVNISKHRYRQAAQLSQRNRAAGCVSFGQKWQTGTGRQYFRDIPGLF